MKINELALALEGKLSYRECSECRFYDFCFNINYEDDILCITLEKLKGFIEGNC